MPRRSTRFARTAPPSRDRSAPASASTSWAAARSARLPLEPSSRPTSAPSRSTARACSPPIIRPGTRRGRRVRASSPRPCGRCRPIRARRRTGRRSTESGPRRAGLDAAGGPVLPAGPGQRRAHLRRRGQPARLVRRLQRPALRRDRPGDGRPRPDRPGRGLRRACSRLARRPSWAGGRGGDGPGPALHLLPPRAGRRRSAAGRFRRPADLRPQRRGRPGLSSLLRAAVDRRPRRRAQRRASRLPAPGRGDGPRRRDQGPVRADLFLGDGPAAGEEAARVRHALRLYRITPAEP